MKTSFGFRLLVLAAIAGCQSLSGHAATFTLTPATIPWNTLEHVNLSVTGLLNHENILVEEFSDLNGNGVLDSGEPLILSFQAQDGEVPLFGGSRDTSRPGDEDGATNGLIRVELVLGKLPERNRAIGNYLFRISSPGNGFPALTQAFNVTQASYGQSIGGKVMGGTVPISAAFVVLMVNSGKDDEFFAGAVTDSSGNFNLNVPPGDYSLIALKSGYVCNVQTSPIVTVASGLNNTQNVSLLPASQNISGKIVDALNSNAIPGVQIFIESQDGQAAFGGTDQSGNFSVPVTAGHWQVQPSEKALTLLGYNRTKLLADTTAANVSGLVMALSRARGEMQMVFFFPNGSFGNGTSGQMSYPTHLQYYYALYNLMDVNVPTNVFFSGPAGSGLANTASAVFGASFQGDSIWYSSPQINVPQYPPGGVYTVNYKNQPQQFAVPDPGAAIRQVVLQPTVSVSVSNVLQQISWTYRDLNGVALPAPDFMASISIRIDGIGGRLYDTDLSPGQTSHVPVQSVIWSNVTSIQMVYNDNLNNQYVTFWDRGLQPLQILSSVLPAGSAGVSYHYFPIGAGGLAPYSWSLITSNLPAGLTFTPVTGEIGGIPSTPGNSSFTIRVQDQSGQALERNLSLAVGSGSSPLSLQPLPVAGPNQFGMRVFGETGHSYQLQASSNLLDWIPLLTTNGSGAPLDLLDSHATNHSQFYRILRTP